MSRVFLLHPRGGSQIKDFLRLHPVGADHWQGHTERRRPDYCLSQRDKSFWGSEPPRDYSIILHGYAA